MDLHHPRLATKGGLGTDITDRRYRVCPQHRLCNIHPVARYRLFLRGKEVGGGKTEFPSPPNSASNPSLDRIRPAKQSGCLSRPPGLQILPDARGADDHPVLHDRADDLHLEPHLFSDFLQINRPAFPILSKGKIIPGVYLSCLDRLTEMLLDKLTWGLV